MARITISEEDLTLTMQQDVTANIIYVPGMAMAEVDVKPRLFTSVDEFEKAYTKTLYKFKNDQEVDGVTIATAGSAEKSYAYAIELLTAGFQIYFQNLIKLDNTVELDNGLLAQFYNKIRGTNQELSAYSEILDKTNYNIKYITAGGYPTILDYDELGLFKTMLMTAAYRADSIALVDTLPTDKFYEDVFVKLNNKLDINIESKQPSDYFIEAGKSGSNYHLQFGINDTVNNNRASECILKYGAIFPACEFTIQSKVLYANEIESIEFCGSFTYLSTLARAIKVYQSNNYDAIAGETRGTVANLVAVKQDVTGSEAEAVQTRENGKIAINPVILIQGYGHCIWGNRTLFPNQPKQAGSDENGTLVASSFLNVRILATDVKKVLFRTCQKCTFETNTTELWLKFKTEIQNTLDQMVANGVLEKYELSKQNSTERATLNVYVKLWTIYAVEDFNVTVALTDSTVEQIG